MVDQITNGDAKSQVRINDKVKAFLWQIAASVVAAAIIGMIVGEEDIHQGQRKRDVVVYVGGGIIHVLRERQVGGVGYEGVDRTAVILRVDECLVQGGHRGRIFHEVTSERRGAGREDDGQRKPEANRHGGASRNL